MQKKNNNNVFDICSACRRSVYDGAGGWIEMHNEKYCPHCGMRMDMFKSMLCKNIKNKFSILRNEELNETHNGRSEANAVDAFRHKN